MRPDGNVVPFSLARPPSADASDARRILMLQGPVGPFFRKLQAHLNETGFDAWRVTFNAGDRIFSGRTKTVGFDDRPSRYASWLKKFLVEGRFSIVILFGCARAVHEIARNVCQKLSIPVLALEEGYFRPGFVTMEEGGNCAVSPVAGRLPDPRSETWADRVRPDHSRPSFGQMGRYAALYYLAHGLFSWPLERRFFHKRARLNLLREGWCWARSAARKYLDLARNSSCIENLLERHDRQFYFVPLQVFDDGQLKLQFGLGWTNKMLIDRLVRSFAHHAPRRTRLVFKVHPIDRGHFDYPAHIRAIAELHGVRARVDFLTSGSVGLMARHSRGMLTINSGSGLSALHHGRPLGVLGRAVYAHPQLVSLLGSDDDIDRFWTESRAASADLRQSYLSWLRARTLTSGDFYLPEEFEATAEAVTNWCDERMKGTTAASDVSRGPAKRWQAARPTAAAR